MSFFVGKGWSILKDLDDALNAPLVVNVALTVPKPPEYPPDRHTKLVFVLPPSIPQLHAWDGVCLLNAIKTGSLLPAWECFNSNTVLRLTLVNGLNLLHPEGYAKLIERANPTFVEAKAYVFVGPSRSRLKFENMPPFSQIKTFAEQLSIHSGYKILDESKTSRVVLLSKLDKKINVSNN